MHIQKTIGDDPSYFDSVEVLVPQLNLNSFQRIVDLLRSESAKEHHLSFCRDEEEVPSSSVDLAIKREAIESFDHAPVPRIRLTLQPKNLGDQRPVLDQNRANLNSWRHKILSKKLAGRA